MNTQYFIYAIEVEKTGSITQAANNLFMSQPTLSKAIRDMESSVGFPVFKRTSKGVVPTQRGTEFLIYAKKIAAQLQKMDAILHAQDTSHWLFSLAIPRVSYIAKAASEYVCSFDNQRDMEVDILETSSMRVIDSVAYGHYVLGVIRYHTEDEDYFLKSLAEAGLQYELLWQSGYVALMRHDHPLAQKEQLSAGDFDPYVEISPSATRRFPTSASASRKRTPVSCEAPNAFLCTTGRPSSICSAPTPARTCGSRRCRRKFSRATD